MGRVVPFREALNLSQVVRDVVFASKAEFIVVCLRHFHRNGEVTIKQRLFRLAEMTGRPLDMALHPVAWLTLGSYGLRSLTPLRISASTVDLRIAISARTLAISAGSVGMLGLNMNRPSTERRQSKSFSHLYDIISKPYWRMLVVATPNVIISFMIATAFRFHTPTAFATCECAGVLSLIVLTTASRPSFCAPTEAAALRPFSRPT